LCEERGAPLPPLSNTFPSSPPSEYPFEPVYSPPLFFDTHPQSIVFRNNCPPDLTFFSMRSRTAFTWFPPFFLPPLLFSLLSPENYTLLVFLRDLLYMGRPPIPFLLEVSLFCRQPPNGKRFMPFWGLPNRGLIEFLFRRC